MINILHYFCVLGGGGLNKKERRTPVNMTAGEMTKEN
jgi:hypothetical protein